MEKIHKPTVICPKTSITTIFRTLLMSSDMDISRELKMEVKQHLVESKGLGDDFDFLIKLSNRPIEQLGSKGGLVKMVCALDMLFLRPSNEKS